MLPHQSELYAGYGEVWRTVPLINWGPANMMESLPPLAPVLVLSALCHYNHSCCLWYNHSTHRMEWYSDKSPEIKIQVCANPATIKGSHYLGMTDKNFEFWLIKSK